MEILVNTTQHVLSAAPDLKSSSISSADWPPAASPHVKFKKSEPIYTRGDEAKHIFFVVEGHVRLTRACVEGKTLTLAILNSGELFGELALAGIKTHAETAEALDDVVVCPVPACIVAGIASCNPQLAQRITEIIAIRRQEFEARIESLLFCTVPIRLARVLLSLARRYPGMSRKGRSFIKLRLTHRELGDLIGANREVVTATLNRFRQDGVISSIRHWIVFRDEGRLRELANEA